jgi:hypothetical protein
MSLPFLLQRMENALTKEGKTCPAVPHPLHQLEFVLVSFDDPIVLRQGQTRFHCFLVPFHTPHKALQLSCSDWFARSQATRQAVPLCACGASE